MRKAQQHGAVLIEERASARGLAGTEPEERQRRLGENRRAELAIDVSALSANELGILIMRTSSAPDTSFYGCREARFVSDGKLILSIPLVATVECERRPDFVEI